MASIVLSASVLAAGSSAVQAAPPPKAQRFVLDNGLRLLVIEQPHLPMVVVNAMIDAGARFDPNGKEGLASLVATLLTEGTKKRSASEVHDAIDFLGARLGGGAGDDTAGVSLTVLRKDFAEGMDLFTEILRQPAFPEAEFERKRAEAVAELEADEQNPGAVADREFRRALFGTGPYRAQSGGWKESVAGLTRDDVRAFYEAAYTPERTILVVSGAMTAAETREHVERRFGDWKPAGVALPTPDVDPARASNVVRIERDLSQANVTWGHLGTTREDPDWYAIQVMNYILGGGGFSSRLLTSIRVEAGLAYSVYSYFRPGKLRGSFQVGLQTKSASTGEALLRMRKEIERIRTEPVSEQELAEAKKFLTGSFPLKFDSNGEMVSFFSQVEYYDLGLDYPERHNSLIESVTAEDVQRVAREYLHPDRALLVIVGKQSDISL